MNSLVVVTPDPSLRKGVILERPLFVLEGIAIIGFLSWDNEELQIFMQFL